MFDPLGYDEEGNYGNEWSQSIWISDRGLTSGYLNDILLHESAHAYSFLTLRGIKTLHVRMQRHCENARVIANYLKKHDKVDNVYWPGFENHPNHNIAKSQMNDFGGMISFTVKGNFDLVKRITSSFKVFTLAESLGGVESLVNHPATMTHASIPKEERDKIGITDNLIRLSVGIEDISDLVDDIKQAIN